MKTKTLSIITVCYNNKDGLKKTIDSVRNQTFKDYEFIVIDGGSNDGSKDVIEANKDLFSFWCSESDGGIYQGMNKGIDHARGEYCLFLNSGDYLINDTIISSVFKQNFFQDVIYGNIIRTKGCKKQKILYSKTLTIKDFYKNSAAIHHQASFIKRELFDKYGKYKENTYMNADWHFFFDVIVIHSCSTIYYDKVISICDACGTSHNYSSASEKVKKDFYNKRKAIESVLPVMAFKDYDEMTKISFIRKVWTSLKWRFSVFVPMSMFK